MDRQMIDQRDYQDFLDQKLHAGAAHGFDPIWMPPQLFDFQQSLVTWASPQGSRCHLCRLRARQDRHAAHMG
jgi:hypothetical protein